MTIRALTFDVYSALFDTIGGLTTAVAGLLSRRGVSGDPGALARAWRGAHAEYLLVATALDREPASNRRAIEAAARFALRNVASALSEEEMAVLLAAWEQLPPWPEAGEVLRAVRARPLVLASLSNGDAQMQRALLGTLRVPFDHVISTEGGRFKPHPSVYAMTLEILGVRAHELLHVAGSATDAMGATAAGITTLWIHRTGAAVLDPRLAPRFEARDLSHVLPALDTLG